jgi:hypothetical protein
LRRVASGLRIEKVRSVAMVRPVLAKFDEERALIAAPS